MKEFNSKFGGNSTAKFIPTTYGADTRDNVAPKHNHNRTMGNR